MNWEHKTTLESEDIEVFATIFPQVRNTPFGFVYSTGVVVNEMIGPLSAHIHRKAVDTCR